MAILEKEVRITLHNKSIRYYEDLGYVIPKYYDNMGKIYRVKRGTKILVKIKDLQPSSNVRLTKICDDCGKHLPNKTYNDIINKRKRNDGIDRCKNCAMKYKWIITKENISYKRSLENYAKENNMEYLLEEFSDKNIKKPNEISYGTEDKYLWKCPVCNEEYFMKTNNRIRYNCPYCSGVKVNETNCLWTTHPEIAKLLKDQQHGYELTSGSGKKEKFICQNCGHESDKRIADVVKQGFSCSRCSDGISYPEKLMMNVLEQLNIKFEIQKKFKWALNKKYDFYIPSKNMLIETNGRQHYESGFNFLGGRSLKEEQENDELKEKLAKENGIENYIVIDCRTSKLDFIKDNILKSELNNLFDLSWVNWYKCHSFALDSMVKLSSDYWNSGIKNTFKIGKLLNINGNTVRRYLKQASELKWCDYDPVKVQKINGILSSQKCRKKIIQLTKENQYIGTYTSISEASKMNGISNSHISNVCKGKPHRNTAGGYKWMYKEDYDQYIKQVN